jgi:hypothetical protein
MARRVSIGTARGPDPTGTRLPAITRFRAIRDTFNSIDPTGIRLMALPVPTRHKEIPESRLTGQRAMRYAQCTLVGGIELALQLRKAVDVASVAAFCF